MRNIPASASTTVRLPADEIGARAADYLVAQADAQPAPQFTPVQISLIVRASAAPPFGLQRNKE